MNRSMDAAVITVREPIFLPSSRPARSKRKIVARDKPRSDSTSAGEYNNRGSDTGVLSMKDVSSRDAAPDPVGEVCIH